jgi:hypothetical protein
MLGQKDCHALVFIHCSVKRPTPEWRVEDGTFVVSRVHYPNNIPFVWKMPADPICFRVLTSTLEIVARVPVR